MNHKLDQGEGRKPYEPPLLSTISLRPEEAVLTHCKTDTSGNMNIGGCVAFGHCKNPGS